MFYKIKFLYYNLIQKQIIEYNLCYNLHEIQKFKLFIKFYYLLACKTALHVAVEKGDMDIIQLLLSHDKLNINGPNI